VNNELTITPKPLNFIKYFLGMICIAFGVVFMLRSNIGLSSWDTLHYSMHKLFNITIGTAMIIVTTIFTLSLVIMNKNLKFIISGLPVFIVGPLIDFLDLILLVDFVPTELSIRLISFTAGILILPLGGAFLLASTFPGGIFDEFMMVVGRKLKTDKIALIRVIMEISAVLTALILGLLASIGIGQINIGTLIFTFTVGVLVKTYLKLFSKIGLYENQQQNNQ
jgi:uncharacterized membrane protein YczE